MAERCQAVGPAATEEPERLIAVKTSCAGMGVVNVGGEFWSCEGSEGVSLYGTVFSRDDNFEATSGSRGLRITALEARMLAALEMSP
jgi:hypothetical protein